MTQLKVAAPRGVATINPLVLDIGVFRGEL